VEERLIYDVGGFDGSDTAYYLSLGYRVVCIEATPSKAEEISRRFSREIADGRCRVLNVAVGEQEGIMPFYTCDFAALNSFDRSRIDSSGYVAHEMRVRVRPFDSIIEEYGIPYFLKVDIEGADHHAILPLTRKTAPKFVSFEAGSKDLRLILHLYEIGYQKFNIVRQADHSVICPPSPGDARHIAWSMRQWFRLALRRHPVLHGVARKMRRGQLGRALGIAARAEHITVSGVTPMEISEGWRDTDCMLRDWTALVASGIIDSSWFDVHAERAA
jgi:FkbM family methyltransferase